MATRLEARKELAPGSILLMMIQRLNPLKERLNNTMAPMVINQIRKGFDLAFLWAIAVSKTAENKISRLQPGNSSCSAP